MRAAMTACRILFAACFWCALATAASAAVEGELRIGVLAFRGAEHAIAEFEPTRAFLQQSMPGIRVRLEPYDLDGLATAVADGSVDFFITNPGQYIELESRFAATRIATLETSWPGEPTDSVGATVFARAGPQAPRTLGALRGRKIAVVAKQAFGGWRVALREIEDAGLPADQLGPIVETGFPMDRVIAAVLDGETDVGVVRSCLLEDEETAGHLRPSAIAIVGEKHVPGFPCKLSSRLYPDWPFAKTRLTAPDLAKKVAARLLAMPASDGRDWTAPLDYTAVQALYRQLKIGPYADLAPPTLTDLLHAYWQFLAVGLLIVGWWIVHVARVETLVRRRTAELEREMHERTRAEQEARTTREQRDQFSRLGIMGEMASTIAHELNQPLAAIVNYAEGMRRMLDSGRADPMLLRDGARGVASQAERAAAIVQRIRSFVRRREAKRAWLDTNTVVRETLALFEGLAASRGVRVYVHLSPETPPVVADRVEIQQVLLNLLQNAVDATTDGAPPGGIGSITVRTSRQGADAKVAVRDSGPPLAPEVEAHLFETFFTTKAQGLGLGLPLCRTIVESHGGRLWAAQNPGGGLTMRFILPGAQEETKT
jgi:two-component system sensor histidine kinase TtrS